MVAARLWLVHLLSGHDVSRRLAISRAQLVLRWHPIGALLNGRLWRRVGRRSGG